MKNIILTPIERLFYENETSFGLISKISDEDLNEIKDNMCLSSENRARINYEIRVRNIELPEELKL